MKTHAAFLLLLLAAASSFADGHTFLWWADGLRGQSPEGRRMLHVQTDRYGMAFDVARASITRIGTFAHPAPYGVAVEDSNAVINGLPPAELILSVTVDGTTYTCTGAAADTKDHANYPVRQIAGGRFLQRFDILGLEFADPAGNRLDATGRLEVAAWPDRYWLTMKITPAKALDDVWMDFDLHEDGSTSQGGSLCNIAAGASGRSTFGWILDKSDPDAGQVRVTDPRDGDAVLPVQYDHVRGGHVVSLPPRNWEMAEDLDRLDRFPVTLENTGDVAMSFPLLFAFEGSFQGITGLSAMSLAIMPANCAPMPSLASLSHSRPRPLSGEGMFSTPALVWPKRITVHCPSGASHSSRPSGAIRAERSTSRAGSATISPGSSFFPTGPAPPVW